MIDIQSHVAENGSGSAKRPRDPTEDEGDRDSGDTKSRSVPFSSSSNIDQLMDTSEEVVPLDSTRFS